MLQRFVINNDEVCKPRRNLCTKRSNVLESVRISSPRGFSTEVSMGIRHVHPPLSTRPFLQRRISYFIRVTGFFEMKLLPGRCARVRRTTLAISRVSYLIKCTYVRLCDIYVCIYIYHIKNQLGTGPSVYFFFLSLPRMVHANTTVTEYSFCYTERCVKKKGERKPTGKLDRSSPE